MPLLHIRALPQSDQTQIQTALKKTCLAIAETYGCDPKHVWATWEEVKAGLYVKGESTANLQPTETHPPIGQLICFECKSPEQI